MSRRKFLKIVTGTLTLVAAGMLTLPFMKSLSPSRHKTRPTREVNFPNLMPGDMKVETWPGGSIYIVRRTQEQLRSLALRDPKLKDIDSLYSEQPIYAENPYRSIEPEILVVFGECTHMACAVTHYPEAKPMHFDSTWNGGFYCPCHSSKFDLSGRVYSGQPAQKNMVVPEYRFKGRHTVSISNVVALR